LPAVADAGLVGLAYPDHERAALDAARLSGGLPTMSSLPTLNRLLVPLDGSDFAEQAIPYAAAIAGPSGRLVFLRVLASSEPARDLLGSLAVAESETPDPAVAEARAALQAAAAKWSSVLSAARVRWTGS
jgi:hypothetical protein